MTKKLFLIFCCGLFCISMMHHSTKTVGLLGSCDNCNKKGVLVIALTKEGRKNPQAVLDLLQTHKIRQNGSLTLDEVVRNQRQTKEERKVKIKEINADPDKPNYVLFARGKLKSVKQYRELLESPLIEDIGFLCVATRTYLGSLFNGFDVNFDNGYKKSVIEGLETLGFEITKKGMGFVRVNTNAIRLQDLCEIQKKIERIDGVKLARPNRGSISLESDPY